jgi:hydroxyacylglutathione hydrolase
MKKKVHDKIFLLTGYCNTYYINDEVKVLIDAGVDYKGRVDMLIITHLHPDHVFYANKIKKRTNCKILIGKGDDFVKHLIPTFFSTWEGEPVELFSVDAVMKKDDVIDTGTYKLRVVPAPGHTKGSTCLFEETHKILFSGDVLFADGYIGRTDFPHSEPNKMSKSLKKLEKLGYKILLPGHGRVIIE